MQLSQHFQKKNTHFIPLLTILLLAIAYCSHLTFLEIDPRLDEVRRGLVTVEMMLSGNYMVPTINAEPYLNKPPLYNWLLAASYKILGINELALRLPVILAIFLFGSFIYLFTSKYLPKKVALISALLFMSNGRILIYDSLMGLIDILYSSLVYAGFMLIYYYGKKEKWYALFISSYFLVVIGYLMKGLPSFVYQGFALMVFFTIEKKWKILFHKAHFAGLVLCFGLLGIYYAIYFQQVQLSPSELFTRLVTESTMRTFREDANWWADFALHFSTYPLVFGYHYAPWTILMLLVIRNNGLKILKQNPFIWYNAILFFTCFFIYWLSPYIIARYMFMLLPLCFTVGAYYYYEVATPNEKLKRIIEYVLMGVLMIAGLGCLVLPFVPETNHLPAATLKAIATATMLLTCAIAAYRFPQWRLSLIILGIVCSRFGFNWFVVVQRGKFSIEQRLEAEKVMRIANGRPIYLQKGAEHGNPDGLSFTIEVAQKRILPLTDSIYPNGVYVTDSATMIKQPHRILYHWASEFQPNHYLVEYPAK
jgi:4-amino-4-deoxy-L-arabinose transferase-like glycosyltransferase